MHKQLPKQEISLSEDCFFLPSMIFQTNAYVLDLKKPGIAKPVKIFQECIQHKEDRQSDKLAFLKEKDAATFAVAQPEDAQGIYEVIASLWGTLHTTPVKTRLSWYQKNPGIDYVVKQEDEVTGYVTIMPMKHRSDRETHGRKDTRMGYHTRRYSSIYPRSTP